MDVILIAAVVQIVTALALARWGRSIALNHEGRWWRVLPKAPLVALVLSLTGAGLAVFFLIRSFGAVASEDPSTKATLLAQNISLAMNCSALLFIPALLIYFVSAVVFFVVWVRD